MLLRWEMEGFIVQQRRATYHTCYLSSAGLLIRGKKKARAICVVYKAAGEKIGASRSQGSRAGGISSSRVMPVKAYAAGR